ncbi:MAG: Shedu anti-phage system protein SduA domain-containing protein, partial [Verrucomicrobiota bacterium]
MNLTEILKANSDEQSVAMFLRDNPEIVWQAYYSVRGHEDFVLAEFPVGSQYRIDLVALTGYSGAWEGNFIELEPISDSLVLADGTYSKRIRGAISQIGDWREYMKIHPHQFRSDLSRWAMKKDR